MGLSPRLRGNPWIRPDHLCAYRSIPAPAGEPRMRTSYAPSRVYPRACGGTVEVARIRALCKAWVYPRACGGTMVCEHAHNHRRVYPRACGGTVRRRASFDWCLGLSPRLRGNRLRRSGRSILGLSPRLRGNQRTATQRLNGGSIPAPAGEPSNRLAVRTCSDIGLSPRLRGNHGQWRAVSLCADSGLSPRLRGNRTSEHPRHGGNHGSIPAPAGEPD